MQRKVIKFPCTLCAQDCPATQSSIECSVCNGWIHRRCVPMGYELLTKWNNPDLQFTCRACCFDGDAYSASRALQRLGNASFSPTQAQAELLLLRTYDICLPEAQEGAATAAAAGVDTTATQILKRYHPIILDTHTPVNVTGDGNCLFRAVSMGLFGTENYYMLIRLLTTIETIVNENHYNYEHAAFVDHFHEPRLIFDRYDKILEDVSKDSSYCGMMAMSAISAALNEAITSYCPPTQGAYFLTEPLSRTVRGRDVSERKLSKITLMWTTSFFPKSVTDFRPNHFVLMSDKRQSDVIDLTAIEDENYDLVVSTAISDVHDDDKDSGDVSSVTSSSKDDDGSGDGDAGGDDNIASAAVLNDDDDDDGDDDDNGGGGGVDIGAGDDDGVDIGGGDDDGGGDGTVGVHANLLPHGRFLEAENVINILKTASSSSNSDCNCIPEVPRGQKDNVYFVVNNGKNVERRKQGKQSQFWDDRGAWVGGSTSRTFYIRENVKLKSITYRQGKYCKQQRQNKRFIQVPLNPQPEAIDVIHLNRYYAKHGTGAEYEKRVSYLVGEDVAPVAIYEFKGCCPVLAPHTYIRTKPAVIEKIKDEVNAKKTSDIYTNTKYSIFEGPCNRRQIYNLKARNKTGGQALPKANFADQVAALEELQHTLPFLQLIVRQSQRVPIIILYTDDQIKDLKRFCCPPHAAQSTVLGIDKTFNLSDVHVTVTVYKCLSVKRRETDAHPIFCGPLLLHGNSDRDTFFMFLQHLSGRLLDCAQLPVLGSDEELALRQAMALAFPHTPRLVCTRHLKKNFTHALADKVGLIKKERQLIVSKVFGENGIIKRASEHQDLVDRMQHLMDSVQNDSVKKLLDRMTPLLVENATAFERTGLQVVSPLWTNNNCESLNHCLKQALSWHSVKLVELVQKLHSIIRMQYRELQRAICGIGEFVLVDEYKRFAVPRDVWYSYSEERRKRHLKKFSGTPKEMLVRSTNSKKVAIEPKHKGRKPGQKKRKVCERTSSVTKKAKTEHQSSDNDLA